MNRTLLATALLAACAAGAQAAPFKLASPDIKPNAMMDKKFEASVFGCNGENK